MPDRHSTHRTLIVGVIAVILVLLAQLFGVFESLDLSASDAAFRLRGVIAPSPNIVIVAIDDETFTQTGLHWPWSRDYFAKLIDSLAQGKPKVVVVDVEFYEKFQGDEDFAAALKRAGNVILANDISAVNDPGFHLEQLNQPITLLAQNAAGIGLSNFVRDADGFSRSILAYQMHDGEPYFHWVVLAAVRFVGAAPPMKPNRTSLQIADRQIPLNDQSLLINFRGPARTFSNIPAYQVVNGDVKPDFFTNKIVLVGATSESLHDTYSTPFRASSQPMPGVEVGANAIDTILSGNFISRLGTSSALGLALILGVIGLGLGMVRPALLALIALIVVAIAYLIGWGFEFIVNSIVLPVVAPELGLLLAFSAPAIQRAATEEAEKRRVRGIFQRFISPQMAREVIEQGIEASRGKRIELTILFSDIRGFTTLSEKMTPDQVVSILNEYLEAMTEIIFRHNGTVDKFEGDAIIAFWGAPTRDARHAQNALAAALEMRQELSHLRAKWGSVDPKSFEIGIGLNTGDVFVGLIGSAKRVNYTVIGDNVNLAARLQDLTKEFSWPVLVSEATYGKVKNEYDLEFAESRLVKGKTVPVRIYRVLGKKGTPENERIHALYS